MNNNYYEPLETNRKLDNSAVRYQVK